MAISRAILLQKKYFNIISLKNYIIVRLRTSFKNNILKIVMRCLVYNGVRKNFVERGGGLIFRKKIEKFVHLFRALRENTIETYYVKLFLRRSQTC